MYLASKPLGHCSTWSQVNQARGIWPTWILWKTSIDNTIGTQAMMSSVVSSLCECSSLGKLRQHRTGFRILPSGKPVVKMNASVLIAMVLTSPALKDITSLPCAVFHCTCFSLTWCSPRIFSCHYCVAVTMRKQVCLRHWIKHVLNRIYGALDRAHALHTLLLYQLCLLNDIASDIVKVNF